jgi:hypothetical protein
MRSLAVFVLTCAALALAACSQPPGNSGKADTGTAGPPDASAAAGADAGGCGASCAQDQVCVKDQCLPKTCTAESCGAEEVCVNGACVAKSCVSVQCPAGQRCAAGNCYKESCGTPVCDAFSACIENACKDYRCYQVTCPTSQICYHGSCYPTSCGATACPAGQVCVKDQCVEKACAAITCDVGFRCSAGACSDCLPGYYPQGAQCLPIKQQGEACSVAVACASGFCVDGVCCDGACAAACHACNGATPGTCAPAAAGDADPLCAAYRCQADGTCASTCAGPADCQAGFSCVAPDCVAKKAKGEDCAAGVECASGNCVDLVCCDTLCDGACDTCHQTGAVGTCSNAPLGSVGAPACGIYLCSGAAPDCPTACTSSAGCAATHYCQVDACVPRLDDGEVCTLAEQCKNSHCVGGTCCDTACTDSCHGCAVTDHLGACWIAANDSCDDQDPCTFDDVCQTDGTCAGWDNTCSSDACVARACNGTGTCDETPLTGATCGGTGTCQSGLCVGDGVCSGAETGLTSPMECCDQSTPCDQSRMNLGAQFCWSVAGVRMWRLPSDTFVNCGSGADICNTLIDCGGNRQGSCVGYHTWDFDHRGDGTVCTTMGSVAGHCQSGVCVP